jgi:hypothetical protein
MAAKKTKKKVTIQLELAAIENLLAAAEALSELASASIMGCDDPKVRALGKKKKKKGGKSRR